MENFTYHNATRLHFGQGQISLIAQEIPTQARVLLLYGGGSIFKNGVHAQVRKALEHHRVVEYGGIEANPDFDTLMPAVKIAMEEPDTFILAVGGGSVLDGAKFVAAAAKFPGDPWALFPPTAAPAAEALPLGTVLTLPGTGSEANGAAVISRRATGEKLHFISPAVYPRFSILDPDTMLSLPPEQLANGIGDAFTHVLEQYMTYPVGAAVQDQFAEGVLRVLATAGPQCLKEPTNYAHRANVMWACTMALNGILGCGVPQDWASHMIGHELTALFGIDHARTLAVVMPGVLTVQQTEKREKLLQYGQSVWAISPELPAEDRVAQAIAKTIEFYETLGLRTRLSQYPEATAAAETSHIVAERLAARGLTALGERGSIDAEKIHAIFQAAA